MFYDRRSRAGNRLRGNGVWPPTGELRGAKILLWPGREWDNASRVIAGVNGGSGFDRDLRQKQDTLHGFDPFQPWRATLFSHGSLLCWIPR